MAAPIKTCFKMKFVGSFRRLFYLKTLQDSINVRFYARGTWRKVVTMNTDEDEEDKMMKKGIFKKFSGGNRPISIPDPSKNPYIEYVPSDPVQRNLKRMASSTHKPKKHANINNNDTHRNKYPIKENRSEPEVSEEMNVMEPEDNGINQSGEREKQNVKTSKTDNIMYEKLEPSNKIFSKAVLATKSKPLREKQKVILLEGRRLIIDALRAGGIMKQLYFNDITLLSGFPEEYLTVPVYKVTYRDVKLWSDTQSPSGIMAIFEKPEQGCIEIDRLPEDILPVTMICDQVRNPGNMGTLIRTAAAVGCRRLLTVKGCVDVWEPKVLRSAMASHFHLPIITNQTWMTIPNYFTSSTHVYIADTRKPEKIMKTFNLEKTEEFVHLSESREEIEGDSERTHLLTKPMKKFYKRTPLSVTSYNKIEAGAKSDIVLIIGGETEGVSPEAKKVAFDNFGEIVTVPMSSIVNSLNTSVAASVILYEIRRQIELTNQNRDIDVKGSIEV